MSRTITLDEQEADWLFEHLKRLAMQTESEVEASLIRRIRNAIALAKPKPA